MCVRVPSGQYARHSKGYSPRGGRGASGGGLFGSGPIHGPGGGPGMAAAHIRNRSNMAIIVDITAIIVAPIGDEFHRVYVDITER